MAANLSILSVPRLTSIVRTLQDQRDIPEDMKFLGRTQVVPTPAGEIMIRTKGNAFVADLITDDAQATVVSGRQYAMETNSVPNIKQGRALSQAMIRQLLELSNQGQGATNGFLQEFLTQDADLLVQGIRQRMEVLLCAMHLDGFNYNKFGVKMDGIDFGMPSEFKVTPSVEWANSASATPFTDIMTLQEIAQIKYGKSFNRLTMSFAAFRAMVKTTEFTTLSKPFLPSNLTPSNLPVQNSEYMQSLVKSIFGNITEIEFYDKRFRYQDENGSIRYERVWPISEVLLSNSADDNNIAVSRFALGPVIESMLMGLLPNSEIIGGRVGMGAEEYGIVSYATVPPTLNPPNLTLWAVASGFPRKDEKEATAKLSVGPLEDVVTPGVTFP